MQKKKLFLGFQMAFHMSESMTTRHFKQCYTCARSYGSENRYTVNGCIIFPLQLLFEVLHRPHRPFSAIVPPPTVYEAF